MSSRRTDSRYSVLMGIPASCQSAQRVGNLAGLILEELGRTCSPSECAAALAIALGVRTRTSGLSLADLCGLAGQAYVAAGDAAGS